MILYFIIIIIILLLVTFFLGKTRGSKDLKRSLQKTPSSFELKTHLQYSSDEGATAAITLGSTATATVEETRCRKNSVHNTCTAE